MFGGIRLLYEGVLFIWKSPAQLPVGTCRGFVGSAVLCCAVLCCAVLCCAVLCCAVLCGAPWVSDVTAVVMQHFVQQHQR
jgi:hypothetical protein